MTAPQFRASLLRGLGVPIGLLAMLAMIVVPLPPLALDVLFTFNIALSLLIVISVFSIRKPLDFAIFPSVLLIATMLRLALNVASTRVVLMHGHTGGAAAGHVIESFGQFVIGGSGDAVGEVAAQRRPDRLHGEGRRARDLRREVVCGRPELVERDDPIGETDGDRVVAGDAATRVEQLGSMLAAMIAALLLYALQYRRLAIEIVIGTLTLWLLVEIVKAISDRDRPFLTLVKARVIGWRERGDSFPSGHTTQVFFLTALLIHHFQFGLLVAVALYAVAALVGFTRIYVGAHYPRDVIAGIVLGSVWGLLAILVDSHWFVSHL